MLGNSCEQLSQGKTATQSSTGWGGVAMRAVDGRADGNWNKRSCTHTKKSTSAGPWWSVDLGSVHWILYVRVQNRVDCCRGRLTGWEVHLSNTPVTDAKSANAGTLCSKRQKFLALDKSGAALVSCVRNGNGKIVPARHVTITMPGQATLMTLCEVQVFGNPKRTLRGPNQQSAKTTTRTASASLSRGTRPTATGTTMANARAAAGTPRLT